MPKRWRSLAVAHLLLRVRAGVEFVAGVPYQRQDNKADRQEAA
jgi:hypothetical protein